MLKLKENVEFEDLEELDLGFEKRYNEKTGEVEKYVTEKYFEEYGYEKTIMIINKCEIDNKIVWLIEPLTATVSMDEFAMIIFKLTNNNLIEEVAQND